MAIKEQDTKAQLSAAPLAIKRTANPSVVQNGVALKAPTDARLKSEQDVAFQAMMKTVTGVDEAERELKQWIFLQNIRQAEEEKAEAFDDINYHLFSEVDLNKKGDLTANDVAAADTRDAKVSGMPVLQIEDGKTSKYLVGQNLSNYLATNPHHVGRMTNVGEVQRSVFSTQFSQSNYNIDLSGPTSLNPRLAKAIRDNPTIASFVEMTINAAKRHGIDPIMLANQFWQESKFNPNAGSNMGAQGIGQIMPKYFAGKYGLNTAADFRDPQKSIEAGAAIMGEITRKYGGDQILALAEYNGGKGAVDFAKKLLGKADISGTEFVIAMEDQVRKFGKGDIGLWRNQTNHYVQTIAGVRAPEPS